MGVSITGYKNSILEEDQFGGRTVLVRVASERLGDVSVGYNTISDYRKVLVERFHTESSKPFDAFVNSGNYESIIDPDKCKELAEAYANADYRPISEDIDEVHESMRTLVTEVALHESGCITIS